MIDHALLAQRVYLELKLVFDTILFVHLNLGGFEFDVQSVQLFLDPVGFFKFLGACLDLEFFDVVVHLLNLFIRLFDVLLQSIHGLLYLCLAF